MHGYTDGDGKDTPGILKQLSKRVGILKRIRRFLTPVSFREVMNGLVNLKLIYAISAWGFVWDLSGVLDTEERRRTANYRFFTIKS